MGTPLHKEQHNKQCARRERGNKREKWCQSVVVLYHMLWRYNSCLEVEANGQACTFIKRAFEIMDVSVWGVGAGTTALQI